MPENTILIKLRTDNQTRADFEEVRQSLQQMGDASVFTKRHIDALGNVTTKTFKVISKDMKGALIQTSSSLFQTTSDLREFRMEFLSTLFFFQNLQRQTQRLMVSSVKAFMEISGEANRTNQAFAAFGANITFIRFALGRAIGEALEPFLPIFTDIVEKIVDFIDQHPDETFWAIAGAFAAFATLNIGSQLVLVIDSLTNIITKAKTAKGGLEELGKFAGASIGIGFFIKGLFDADNNPIESIGAFITSFGIFRSMFVGFSGGLPLIAVGLTLQFVANPKLAGQVVGAITNIFVTVARIVTELITGMIEAILTFDTSKLKATFKEIMGGVGEFQQGVLSMMSEENINFIDRMGNAHMKLATQQIPNTTKSIDTMSLALGRSETKFTSLADIATFSINKIIQRLNAIPKEINVRVNVTENITKIERGSRRT